MAWSDAARRAAALARKAKAAGRSKQLVSRSNDYYGSVRGQSQARSLLVKQGRHPITGRKIGRSAARRALYARGDMEND